MFSLSGRSGVSWCSVVYGFKIGVLLHEKGVCEEVSCMQDGKKSPQVAHRLPFLCHVPKSPLLSSPLSCVFLGISEVWCEEL